MVNDTEVKNGQEEVGTNKTSELIDTQEGMLDLLRDLAPKNELTSEDANAFSVSLPKDKASQMALILFLKDQDKTRRKSLERVQFLQKLILNVQSSQDLHEKMKFESLLASLMNPWMN